MSGFLRRIVRQASLQETAHLHPAAKLPFAPPPHLVEPEGTGPTGDPGEPLEGTRFPSHRQTDSFSAVQTRDERPPEGTEVLPVPGGAGVSPGGGASSERNVRESPGGKSPISPDRRGTGDINPHAEEAAARGMEVSLPLGAVSRFPREIVRREGPRDATLEASTGGGKAPPRPFSPVRNTLHPPESVPPQPGRALSDPGTGDAGIPANGEAAGPASLKPWTGIPGQTGDRYARFRTSDLPSVYGKDEEPTEVHVHIGRIEVTAVPETPPEPVGRRKRPGPMSLDEYLARRQRRPS